jgi:hypothetical protein
VRVTRQVIPDAWGRWGSSTGQAGPAIALTEWSRPLQYDCMLLDYITAACSWNDSLLPCVPAARQSVESSTDTANLIFIMSTLRLD